MDYRLARSLMVMVMAMELWQEEDERKIKMLVVG
jgi:hypothetical protein